MGEKWTVVAQQPTMGKLPDGTFGDVVRITYRTAAGVLGVVIVPATDYTVDKVREMIDAEAEARDAVADL